MKRTSTSWQKNILGASMLAIGLTTFGPGAAAQGPANGKWPERAITMLVGFPPGQATDTNARLISDTLSHDLGQSVVVENRPGQAGSIAASLLKRAPADGYTIALMATASLTTNPHLYSSISYDPLKDFIPISKIAMGPLMLAANPDAPFSSVQELVAYAKTHPGELNYCSTGKGTISHLAMESFQQRAGISMVHVPYQGSTRAMNDLAAGRVSVCFDTVTGMLPLLSAGKVKAIALAGATRSPVYPDIPTVAEAGFPGFEAAPYIGLLYPAGTPQEIVERMSSELKKVGLSPKVRRQIESTGTTVVFNTPEEFAAEIRADYEKWGRIIRELGLALD